MIKLSFEFATMSEMKQFVDRLTATGAVSGTTAPPKVDAVAEPPAKTTKSKTAAVDAVAKDESKEVTIADLVALAVKKSGADPKAMVAIKELCATHGVKKLTELPKEKLAEVHEAISKL